MNLQIDGNQALDQQELQLQAIETFFVEVIDYQASSSNQTNDVTTKPVTAPLGQRIRLKVVQSAAEAGQATAAASAVVFDRTGLVAGQRKRVLGFRA